MADNWREYLPIDLRRRAVRLVAPGTQLRLPAYVLMLTLGFGALFALNGYLAFERIYNATVMTAAPEMESLINAQARNFAITSSCLGLGYLITMVVACVSYLHRIVGAAIPMQRHVVALTEGDYASRLQLRRGDAAMSGLADDLNELARALEQAAPKPDSEDALPRA